MSEPITQTRSWQGPRAVPVQSISFDDYADMVREADLEFLMTGPSRSPWTVGQCAINSIVLQFGAEGGPKIAHGISRADALIFLIPYKKFADRVIFDGQEVQPYDFGVLPPSSHFSAATFGAHRWMSITLPLGLFREVAAQVGKNDLEWVEREKCLISTSQGLVEGLTAEAEKKAAHVATATLGRRVHGSVEIPLLKSLIAAVAGAKNKISLSDDTAKSSREIVSGTLDYVRRHKWEPIQVDQLALAAQVTDRTLLRSFRQQLGIGPARYLKVRQLNIVRRALRGKLGIPLNVTIIMREHGVSELGRFATEYKTLFGESPSETKRRHSTG